MADRLTITDQNVFADWTPKTSEQFWNAPVTAHHRLAESGLFTDEALADLIDRHPVDYIDILTMPEGYCRPEDWRGGVWDGLTGAELIEAVKRGRIWINIRKCMVMDPDYRPIFDAMYGFLKANKKGFKPIDAQGAILISSPGANVPPHVDVTHTMLWHVRGKKRVWLYPRDETHISTTDMEKSILVEIDGLDMNPEKEANAFAMDLEPGMWGAWQLNQPHRVENVSGMNVSVATEYSTLKSKIINGAFFANAMFRRRFGIAFRPRRKVGMGELTLFAFARVFRLIGWDSKEKQPHPRTFRVDLKAPNCVADFTSEEFIHTSVSKVTGQVA